MAIVGGFVGFVLGVHSPNRVILFEITSILQEKKDCAARGGELRMVADEKKSNSYIVYFVPDALKCVQPDVSEKTLWTKKI